jgi:hypothetical protein
MHYEGLSVTEDFGQARKKGIVLAEIIAAEKLEIDSGSPSFPKAAPTAWKEESCSATTPTRPTARPTRHRPRLSPRTTSTTRGWCHPCRPTTARKRQRPRRSPQLIGVLAKAAAWHLPLPSPPRPP